MHAERVSLAHATLLQPLVERSPARRRRDCPLQLLRLAGVITKLHLYKLSNLMWLMCTGQQATESFTCRPQRPIIAMVLTHVALRS